MRQAVLFLIPGLALSLAFFLFLGQLIGVNGHPDTERSEAIHLTLTNNGTQSLQTRQRREPPPPPPKMAQMPSLPTVNAGTSNPVNTPQVNAVNIALNQQLSSSDIQLSASVGSLTNVQVSSAIEDNPVAVSQIPPQYPQRALRHRIEGDVTIEFTILPDGRVKPGSIQVVKANPEHIFDNAVKRAVYGWRFQPKQFQGKAIAFQARQTLAFKLEK
ncbi:energy transducer TonB [Celerinatantimonas sp. YJH-8]|uniref:energy transducer TonB n=1 Tax=Celerinatantimonas sp. YJH-8 TaxID=3228714 RepID=UPI0038C25810